MNRLCGLILTRAKEVFRPFIPLDRPPNWYHNSRAALLIAGGIFAPTYYYKHLEAVPYTNRIRFALYPPTTERHLIDFERVKSKHNKDGILLSPNHLHSVRVQFILYRIVDAARRSRKSILPYLFDWEAIVVRDDNKAEAYYCNLGGKIIIYTKTLESCRNDAEIAWMISHAVGSAIARHPEETLIQMMFRIPYIILLRRFHSFIQNIAKLLLTEMVSQLLIHRPLSRRRKIEADYIGLLLLASAGYDPRVVPKIFDQLGETDVSEWKTTFHELITNYFSGHPSHNKRSQLASQAMEEALALYEKSISDDNFIKVWLRNRSFGGMFDFLQRLIVYFFSF